MLCEISLQLELVSRFVFLLELVKLVSQCLEVLHKLSVQPELVKKVNLCLHMKKSLVDR